MYWNMTRFSTDAARFTNDERFWPSHHPMMWGLGNGGAFWVVSILWFVTWILLIIVLIALIRWLWKKGDKIK